MIIDTALEHTAYKAGQPVSVVFICHNKADNLKYILESLAKGTRRPDCIVLSDDASTDNSPAIFSEICDCLGLTSQVVSHAPNGRTPSFRINTLRNNGIAACPDGLVIVLDADLVPARTLVEAHVDMHLKHAPTPTVSTGPRFEYAYPDCGGPINFMWGHEPVAMLQASSKEPVPTWTAVPGSLMAITKGAFERLGQFDPAYDGYYGFDDVDFMYRAAQAGVFFAASFEAYAIHIPHPPAFINRDNAVNRKRFKDKYHFDFYTAHPPIFKLMGRGAWSEYYQQLLGQAHGSGQKAASVARAPSIHMLNLETIGGWYLLRVILRRALRKLRRAIPAKA